MFTTFLETLETVLDTDPLDTRAKLMRMGIGLALLGIFWGFVFYFDKSF